MTWVIVQIWISGQGYYLWKKKRKNSDMPFEFVHFARRCETMMIRATQSLNVVVIQGNIISVKEVMSTWGGNQWKLE